MTWLQGCSGIIERVMQYDAPFGITIIPVWRLITRLPEIYVVVFGISAYFSVDLWYLDIDACVLIHHCITWLRNLRLQLFYGIVLIHRPITYSTTTHMATGKTSNSTSRWLHSRLMCSAICLLICHGWWPWNWDSPKKIQPCTSTSMDNSASEKSPEPQAS